MTMGKPKKFKRKTEMERNINGYPEPSQNGAGDACMPDEGASLGGRPIGYAYVPIQAFRMIYLPDKALMRGTLFEELDLPVEVYGK